MFVVLATSVVFGYAFGVIQGYMDPESHRSVYVIMNRFSRELELSQVFGMYIGAASAFIIEGLRQMEMKYRKPISGKNSLDR